MPVRWVEDDIGITGAVVSQSLAQAIAERYQPLGRAGQTARQVKKAKKVSQPRKLEQVFLRSGQHKAFGPGPLRDGCRLKTAFQMQVNFCLGQ